ncbi:hypothetical protein [Desulfonatronum sp. SC1]|uniref:hypothetical protein n=1 Tax=Desulfonatronum sp. SC1 TaxID=2109626 RepID=UPI000D310F5C|nr:hypothetical protein [Desulfonatronum sp. SC1]PTN36062.1 hypothetical protein C6366_09975 [Desulfonatronum sp. SC1]
MAERLDKRLVLNEWLFSLLGYSDTEQGMKQVAKILRDEPVGVIEAKRAAHLGHGRSRKEIIGCLGLHKSTVSSILKGKY